MESPIDGMIKDATEYVYSTKNKEASYEQLYFYLESIGYKLSKDESKTIKIFDRNVIYVYGYVTNVILLDQDFIVDKEASIVARGFGVHNKPSVTNSMHGGILDQHERLLKDEAKIKAEEEKRALQEKDHREFTLSRSNYVWAITGIIAGILIGLAQIGFSYYDIHYGKDFKHETRIIELDSMQVEQNKKIIELLEKNK